jgi:peptidyl-dipeptidase A
MRRFGLFLAFVVVACGGESTMKQCPAVPTPLPPAPSPSVASSVAAPSQPSAADAIRFIGEVDKELRRLWVWGSRASWVNKNFITYDTNALSSEAEEANMAYLAKVIPEAAKFDGVEGIPADVKRQLELLKHATSLPAPSDAAKRAELAKISVELESTSPSSSRRARSVSTSRSSRRSSASRVTRRC